MYLFGIGAGMEHHIPPQLNAVRSIRGNAKEEKKLKPDRRPRDIDDNDAFLLFLS
jgi:hypothetical protein